MQTAVRYEWIALPTGTNTMPEFQRDRLRERRKDMGFSQITLAKAMKVGQSEVSAWETGNRSPDPDNVAKICAALEVTMDWLYGLVDKPHDVLKEQSLSEFEFKMVHRTRIDPEAKQRVDEALLLNKPKQYPALPEPKKGNDSDQAASADKKPAED